MRKLLVIIFLLILINLSALEIFIVNSTSETLTKFNTETGEVDNDFATLGLYTNRIALTEDYGYVVNSGDNAIQKIDLDSGATLANIIVAAGCNPYDIVLYGDYAYVSGLLTNTVYKIDLNTDTVVGNVSVGVGPAGLVVLNEKLYVACSGSYPSYTDSQVAVIDLSSFVVDTLVDVSANAQYLTIVDSQVHVACSSAWGDNTGSINVIDPATNTVTSTIDLGGYLGNMWYAENGKVYVADGNNAGMYAYDPTDFSAVYTFTNSFSTPGSLVYGTSDKLFIVDSQWGSNGTLKEFNMNEEFQVEYTVGMSPTDIKVRPNSTSNEDIVQPQVDVSLYPNPFVDRISIKSDSNYKFTCYDVRGRKVFTEQIVPGDNTLEMKSIPTGIYFYKVSDNRNTLKTGKILKAK